MVDPVALAVAGVHGEAEGAASQSIIAAGSR